MFKATKEDAIDFIKENLSAEYGSPNDAENIYEYLVADGIDALLIEYLEEALESGSIDLNELAAEIGE